MSFLQEDFEEEAQMILDLLKFAGILVAYYLIKTILQVGLGKFWVLGFVGLVLLHLSCSPKEVKNK